MRGCRFPRLERARRLAGSCRVLCASALQYPLDDASFAATGMRAVDKRIAAHYKAAGAAEAYVGEF